MELEVSEQLEMLCDTRLEGGEEGFEAAVAEMPREGLEALLGEAVDALLDAQTHEREAVLHNASSRKASAAPAFGTVIRTAEWEST